MNKKKVSHETKKLDEEEEDQNDIQQWHYFYISISKIYY